MLEEVRAVGSMKTMSNLAGHMTADVVVLMKVIPTSKTVGFGGGGGGGVVKERVGGCRREGWG